MVAILNRIKSFLIYILNNDLFAKGRDLKYLKNTSYLFIDQIESELKNYENYLSEMEAEKANG